MTDATEVLLDLLAGALGALEEGIAVLDHQARVVFWNAAAELMTGHTATTLIARPLPANFYSAYGGHSGSGASYEQQPGVAERPSLVQLQHSRGHTLPAMLRRLPLRDALGQPIGILLRFHPAEEVDAMARGDIDEENDLDKHVEHSQASMEERLDEALQDWSVNQVPFGVLWVTIDQAAMLRKTHGRDACEAMLAIVERTVLHALRPAELLGRWGSNEFLVLCHERTEEMLMLHGRHVCGFARTAEFRWWGDRISLTLSVGAAQAGAGEKLGSLLKRAQRAMQSSQAAGGNQVVLEEWERNRGNSGGQECSQS